ncbi:type II secretion system protein [Calycomorphotria hydatis]|uniref:Type II secretion system protein G n=1 Tax=Calycomorphotria hydatis TaxID=2528027 RepID=A0A517T5G3_9PLAN|nr:type II secretion system protein GspG [Calycomorphotria hydatis]QDT63625.1 Type II secretion system protein G precursor [Calycomorphotria hydatis]
MTSHSPRRRKGGFTLLEVLLVLAILGVIAAMVVPQLLGRQKKALVDATKNSITGLEQSLKLYAIDHDGEYPQGGQDALTLLIEPVDDDGKAIEPYLEKVPTDGWDSPLYYEYPNTKAANSTKPAIWSAGPNKRSEDGGGDDVNNWSN